MNNRNGISLIDILAIVLVATLLLFVVWTNISFRPRPQAYRTSCLNNIRQIGLAMIQYAYDHDGTFPNLVDPDGNEIPAVDAEGFISTRPGRTAFALLLKEGYLTTTKVFVCPSSTDRATDDTFPDDYKNTALEDLILAERNCSYGWDPTKRRDKADAWCALIADKPPEDVSQTHEGTAGNNSRNHTGEGQNVFYNDGHVKWATTPRADTWREKPGPDDVNDLDIYLGGSGYETSTWDAKIVR